MNPLRIYGLLLFFAGLSHAEITLPAIIDSGMILQRDAQVPIWGWASEGETITVSFAGQTKTATPDESGKWMIELDPLPASSESRNMKIRGEDEITLSDILVGEVWLAAGQSNMEWTFAKIIPEEQSFAKSQTGNQLVRSFHVSEHLTAGVPMDDTIGSWKNAKQMIGEEPSTSAVAFFFALRLQKELGIPIAILDANWGGRPIEAFIPNEGYKATGLRIPKDQRQSVDMEQAQSQLKANQKTIEQTSKLASRGISRAFNLNTVYGEAPNYIHNAMIAPLAPFAIKGAIWYQGESNRNASDYFEKTKALVTGWSKIFRVENLPFLQVQIAPYDYSRGRNPRLSILCDNIWRAQFRADLEINNVGIVAVHDTVTNLRDIHPPSKRPVGERLAALALNEQYGKKIISSGPKFSSAKLEGDQIIIMFEGIDQGLTTTDGEAPSWIETSADGKNFSPAAAKIVGDKVVVSTKGMPEPKFIRMGWANTAIPNLADINGWPAFAFPPTKL